MHRPHDSTAPIRPGRLYLVPAPLDFGCLRPDEPTAPVDVLPEGTMAIAARLEYWLCENARTLRAGLKRIGQRHTLAQPIQALRITELPRAMHKKGDHAGASSLRAGSPSPSPSRKNPPASPATPPAELRALLAPALQEGHDIGLASEAGMPAIADPGSSIVRAAHQWGIPVIPLVGPVSLMLALAASGLNGQSFAFAGYLPQDSAQRIQRLRELENLALRTGQSQIFIETPYRNHAMLDSLVAHLQPHTWLSVSWGLTLDAQGLSHTASASIQHWQRDGLALRPPEKIMALPAVYVLGC